MLGVEPDGGQVGEGLVDQFLVVADLDGDDAARIQMLARLVQDAPHHVESIAPGGECQGRFVSVFGGQGLHRRRRDIGRVADDQVVTAPLGLGEEVGLDGMHAVFEAVVGNVAARDFKRFRRDVDGVDRGIGKGVGHDDGQAARAGAQVERRCDGLRVFDPGREAVFEQFGEIGTRHDHARIDMEAELAEPGFVQQVGRRQAMHHALLQAFQQRVALAAGKACIEKRLQRVARQMQGGKHDPDRLIPGIVGAVAKMQAGLVEAADGPAQPVADGDKLLGGAVDHSESSFSNVSS